MPKEYKLTKAGVEELKTELAELKARRLEVVEQLKKAREYGDLGENAEYHAAREEQVQVESRISEIENILGSVTIIKEPADNNDVELGNTVVLSGSGGKKVLSIVGSVEADPTANKISDESPLGQALLGKKVGDQVEIKTPGGTALYTVQEIK